MRHCISCSWPHAPLPLPPGQSLYGMAGTCTRWRAVALPMLVGKAWKGKPGKLVHPSQLFIRTVSCV